MAMCCDCVQKLQVSVKKQKKTTLTLRILVLWRYRCVWSGRKNQEQGDMKCKLLHDLPSKAVFFFPSIIYGSVPACRRQTTGLSPPISSPASSAALHKCITRIHGVRREGRRAVWWTIIFQDIQRGDTHLSLPVKVGEAKEKLRTNKCGPGKRKRGCIGLNCLRRAEWKLSGGGRAAEKTARWIEVKPPCQDGAKYGSSKGKPSHV